MNNARDTRTHEVIQTEELPEIITAAEVARLLRVSRKTVYAAFKRGELPGGFRVGNSLRFHRDAVLKWMRGEALEGAGAERSFVASTTCPLCGTGTAVERRDADSILYVCKSETCAGHGYSRMLQVLDDGTVCDCERAMNLGAAQLLEVHNHGGTCDVTVVTSEATGRASVDGSLSLLQALGNVPTAAKA